MIHELTPRSLACVWLHYDYQTEPVTHYHDNHFQLLVT